MAIVMSSERAGDAPDIAAVCPECGRVIDGESEKPVKARSTRKGAVVGLVGSGALTLIIIGAVPFLMGFGIAGLGVPAVVLLDLAGLISVPVSLILFAVSAAMANRMGRKGALSLGAACFGLSAICLVSMIVRLRSLTVYSLWLLWEPIAMVVGAAMMISVYLKLAKSE